MKRMLWIVATAVLGCGGSGATGQACLTYTERMCAAGVRCDVIDLQDRARCEDLGIETIDNMQRSCGWSDERTEAICDKASALARGSCASIIALGEVASDPRQDACGPIR